MFRLAKLSLANRALIALITVFACVFGVITMSSLKQELIPSIEFPQITVISSMPGASPEVVDKQISAPLEKALNSVEGLESTSSTSRNGVSLQPGPGQEPDRPRHLQRQAGPAEGRPAAGDRREHQRLPDRLPGRVLRQTAQ
ncbi:Swarming motility protein SwrC [Microbacterium sp. Bi128]|nr:Swarming motility protein SwrC [Microbacterium sp. Bi128]